MIQKNNIEMQLITRNKRLLRFIFAVLAGLCFLLQAGFSLIVLFHNFSGKHYEYVAPNWFLLLLLIFCLLGLFGVIKLMYRPKRNAWIKISLLFIVIISLSLVRPAVQRISNAPAFCGGKLMAMEFLTDDVGYVFVNINQTNLSIFKTTDGGSFWRCVFTYSYANGFLLFPNVYSKEDAIYGMMLLYDDDGFQGSPVSFCFNTATQVFDYDYRPCENNDIARNLYYADEVELFLVENKYNKCYGADTLNNQIVVLLSDSFRHKLFYSKDYGSNWHNYSIPASTYGPISISKHYIYVCEKDQVLKYSVNDSNWHLERLHLDTSAQK